MMEKALVVFLAATLVACQTVPDNLFILSPESLQQRQLETRRFGEIAEAELLSASNNVLQDLGFNLENSEVELGVLTASKQRDASIPGEIVGAVLVRVLTGRRMSISKDQTIRVCLVIGPSRNDKGEAATSSHLVRVTFQRVVRKSDNSIVSETIRESELYQQFFERLSMSVFVEAETI